MARVILAPYIKSISGKVGNLEFRTLKSGKTVVHTRRLFDDDQPPHKPTPAEIAQRRRFGIVSSIVAEIQNHYKRIDQAAADRKLIWERVTYAYRKLTQRNPALNDEEIRLILFNQYQADFPTQKWGLNGVSTDSKRTPKGNRKKKGGKNE